MSGRIAVLLVEDDEPLRESLSSYLRLSGFEVTAVGDGLSFYRCLAQARYAVLVIDPESRKVLQVNDKFIRLSGVSAEDMLGRTTRELNLWRHQSDRERFYELLVTNGPLKKTPVFQVGQGSAVPILVTE